MQLISNLDRDACNGTEPFEESVNLLSTVRMLERYFHSISDSVRQRIACVAFESHAITDVQYFACVTSHKVYHPDVPGDLVFQRSFH